MQSSSASSHISSLSSRTGIPFPVAPTIGLWHYPNTTWSFDFQFWGHPFTQVLDDDVRGAIRDAEHDLTTLIKEYGTSYELEFGYWLSSSTHKIKFVFLQHPEVSRKITYSDALQIMMGISYFMEHGGARWQHENRFELEQGGVKLGMVSCFTDSNDELRKLEILQLEEEGVGAGNVTGIVDSPATS